LEEIYFQHPHNKIKKKNNTTIKTMQKKPTWHLKVKWSFSNQTYITHNAFQLSLTDEDIKCSIHICGRSYHVWQGHRYRMIVGFTTTYAISAYRF
jgi:hypothetical protein